MSKNKKPSKIKQILDKLKINDEYTKRNKYVFDKVKNNTFPKHSFNEMADILMLPTTDKGYKYCLVIVDLWSNFFDFEKMKTKSAKETLEALLKIFKRHYVDQPKASLKTDNDGAFQSIFQKWLTDHHIAHLQSLPDRHKQMANVENVNRQLGNIFMTYLTSKSIELGHDYNNWTDIEDDVRTELNKVKYHPKDQDPYTYPMSTPTVSAPPKFKVGDTVYRPLEKPENISGDRVFGTFRSGDRRYSLIPTKVKRVFLYENNWRYQLEGFENVAYAEAELLKAKETEQMYEVQSIRDMRKTGNKVEYLIKWKGYKVSESTWEPKSELLKDLGKEKLDQLIEDYNESSKPKKKVTKK